MVDILNMRDKSILLRSKENDITDRCKITIRDGIIYDDKGNEIGSMHIDYSLEHYLKEMWYRYDKYDEVMKWVEELMEACKGCPHYNEIVYGIKEDTLRYCDRCVIDGTSR